MMKGSGGLLIVGSLIVSGCSYLESSKEERVCRAFIESVTLNPETLEFYDFRPFSGDELRKMTGVDTSFELAMDEEGHAAVSDAIDQTTESVDRMSEITGMQSYLFRVKSEGRLGNLVTIQYTCSVKDDFCYCAETAL